MLRWGILSTAKIARVHLIPAILAAEGSVLAAIASRDGDRARALADDCGAPHAFGSYEALLDSDAVDAVYVPVPTAHHVEWATKAVRAGKHVLVEKPLALKAADIEPLIAARDEQGVVVAEAFMVKHHPQWAQVRDWIDAGRIGRLLHVQGAFSYFNDDPANMRNVVELGGGALPDIGVYPIVVTRLVTGAEPVSALGRIERDPRFGTDRFADCTVDFDTFRLSFYVGTQAAARQSMVFHGSDGFIEIEAPFNAGVYGDTRVVLHDRGHQDAEIRRFPAVNQYREQVETFSRRVAGEAVAIFSLEESVLNQRVVDALLRSESSGRHESV